MVFREGDEILINAAGSRIRLRTKDRIDAEAVLLDEDEDGALMFLKEIILPRVNIKDSEQPSGEASKLLGIIEEKDAAGALAYLREVVRPQITGYVRRPGCKPVFELPGKEEITGPPS